MSKRVLLLDNKQGDGGGGGRYLLNLAQLLLDVGYRLDVAFLLAADDRCLRTELQEMGATVHDILDDEIKPCEVAAWLNEFLKSSTIDALHVNWGGPEMRESLTAWDVNPAWRGRRIYTLHGPLESAVSLASWTWRDRFPFSWRRRKRRRLASFFRAFDRVISVSQHNAEEALRLYRLEPSSVVFVPNGVDVNAFTPRKTDPLDSGNAPIRIGTCCRLSKQKRLDVLINAFSHLANDNDVELHIAGEGPEGESLKSLCDQRGLNSRAHFDGFQRDVNAFLQTLDIFAMTSEREGLPYALLEAMSCGLPSVVTDVNELPYIVRDGQEGCLIPTDDVDACQGRLSDLVNDWVLRRRMGDSARKRVCAEFSHGQWQARTLKVYEGLLA